MISIRVFCANKDAMIKFFLREDERHLHVARTALFRERFAAVATRHGYAHMSDHALLSDSSGLHHDGDVIPPRHELGAVYTTGVSTYSATVKGLNNRHCHTLRLCRGYSVRPETTLGTSRKTSPSSKVPKRS